MGEAGRGTSFKASTGLSNKMQGRKGGINVQGGIPYTWGKVRKKMVVSRRGSSDSSVGATITVLQIGHDACGAKNGEQRCKATEPERRR